MSQDDSQMAEADAPEAIDTSLTPAAASAFPSIHRDVLLSGASYEHFSPVPPALQPPGDSSAPSASEPGVGPPCALGVDEAGRGPVLGPMVYGVFYLPLPLSDPLLKETHHFDDSKVLTPQVRSDLFRALCTAGSDLHASCGWAVAALSARDIAAGMMRPASAASYNLNAQAVDATVSLIRGVLARGVNVTEIYVDTVGPPAAYQQRLQRLFPSQRVTVAKKADSLYPCVSAASVCAKVTRDAALEVLYEPYRRRRQQQQPDGTQREDEDAEGKHQEDEEEETMAWGSGYPSDARCVSWLRQNMHPVFGWGPECRFSWGTVKDMLEAKGTGVVKVDWPVDDDGETTHLTDYFASADKGRDTSELGTWFGTPAGQEAF